ncbi:4-vinyl reductase [Hydrogenobaculum acidophilum]
MGESMEFRDNLRILAEAIERESVLIHRSALIDGYKELFKLNAIGVGKFVKKAAELGGKKGAITLKERYEVTTDKLSEALDLLTIIAESSRLITFMETSLEKMEIYIEGSILVEAIPESKKPVCEPMAGFFSGFLTELLQTKYNVTEISCQAQGHEKCVFKIKKETSK